MTETTTSTSAPLVWVQDISEEMRRYREIVFRDDRFIPFTMIEARAILKLIRNLNDHYIGA